jgi:hypothetical protein
MATRVPSHQSRSCLKKLGNGPRSTTISGPCSRFDSEKNWSDARYLPLDQRDRNVAFDERDAVTTPLGRPRRTCQRVINMHER